jgi:uncharacterized protein
MDLSEKNYFYNCAYEIISSSCYGELGKFIQHGETTVLEHSISVAYYSYRFGSGLRIKCDYESLIRGALLHDFFLYDWHVYDKSHTLHGFKHAKTALKNAEKFFPLNYKERDIIKKHMWPLNLSLPRYKESYIVWAADKYSAVIEMTVRVFKLKNKFVGKLVYDTINLEK